MPKKPKRWRTAVLLGLLLVFVWLLFCPPPSRSRETHSFPGTTHPTIEIRLTGFLDASFFARLKNGWFHKRLVALPGYSAVRDKPAGARTGQGTVSVANPDWTALYNVTWSEDGDRVAFSMHGWYVAAYDFRHGSALQIPSSSADLAAFDKEVAEFLATGLHR